jgi:hypothetical protein
MGMRRRSKPQTKSRQQGGFYFTHRLVESKRFGKKLIQHILLILDTLPDYNPPAQIPAMTFLSAAFGAILDPLVQH